MYLTYDDYLNMGGTLDETTFNEMEFEAECLVNWYTFNRLKKQTTYPEELTRCMYALIKLVQAQSSTIPKFNANGSVNAGESLIASQSNDGVSISYATLSAADLVNSCKGKIESTISMYLSDVCNELGQKLLYRGMYPNE